MEKIAVKNYIKYLESRWPEKSIQKLKQHLVCKGVLTHNILMGQEKLDK